MLYTNTDAKNACLAECVKRNKHISRFHPCRWRPLWTQGKGWFPALRPAAK